MSQHMNRRGFLRKLAAAAFGSLVAADLLHDQPKLIGPVVVDPETGETLTAHSYNDGGADWDYYEFSGSDGVEVVALGTSSYWGSQIEYIGGGTLRVKAR